ncbi:MAG: DUF1302 family protein [Nevskia sp.]|nr:DUF1302 family protein [Nevskia sp.]
MVNKTRLCWLAGLGLAGAVAGSANAEINYSFDGFVRSETAFKANETENEFNNIKGGNPFIGHGYCGPTVVAFVPAGTYCTSQLSDNPGGGRSGQRANNVINMQMFRVELESQVKFNQYWTLQAKLRGVVDPGWYDQFSPGQVHSAVENPANAPGGDPGGLSASRSNPGGLYGRPNYFKYQVDGLHNPQPMEWTGRNYQVYFPALFMEYNAGPLDVRLGMQQIAWGQALFFRVLDVVDGLDLRRHSALDLGAEEFSDKRVPAPALRINYQINDNILADAFFQKFQPSVLPNPNTPYNVIASEFTVHDKYADYDNRGDYGLRLKAQFGDLSMQAIAVHRWNPDGVFKWTRSGVHRTLNPAGGPDMAGTAFQQDSTGTQAAQEWFHFAAASRLNGVTGLNTAITNFPDAMAAGAFAVNSANCAAVGALPAGNDADNSHSLDAYNCATKELNSFFALSGGLRGHLDRDYRAENDYGGGIGYVISAEPGSLLDQLIINVEATYTPNRTFTAPDLDPNNYVHKHEWVTALVMEKYQRFFINLPATYMVFQWEHRTQSDLYGRYAGGDHGGGMGGSDAQAANGQGGGNNYLVFAFQQPFPNLIWRFDMSILGDVRGGLLVQPALRWKPDGNWTVNAFYNYLNGNLGGRNNNIVSTVDYDKEVTLRIGYQF